MTATHASVRTIRVSSNLNGADVQTPAEPARFRTHHGGQNPQSTRGRLFVVPAASLRRDPAALHKYAYVRLIAEAFGAELFRFRDERTAAAEVLSFKPSLVITMNVPWYARVSDHLIRAIPQGTRLVTIHDDCRRQMHPQLANILDRSDAVIAPIREPVLRSDQFPSIAPRLWRLPYFIPDGLPEYAIDNVRNPQCLLPGRVSRNYPLRRRALRDVPSELLVRLSHPGYWRKSYDGATVGRAYFDQLHQYLGALTSGSVYGYVVAKYLEIPYAGTLLLAEDLPDLVEMGFEAGRHFVAIDQRTNLKQLLAHICENPEDYAEIRSCGQELVRARHTEAARRTAAQHMADEIVRRLGLNDEDFGPINPIAVAP